MRRDGLQNTHHHRVNLYRRDVSAMEREQVVSRDILAMCDACNFSSLIPSKGGGVENRKRDWTRRVSRRRWRTMIRKRLSLCRPQMDAEVRSTPVLTQKARNALLTRERVHPILPPSKQTCIKIGISKSVGIVAKVPSGMMILDDLRRTSIDRYTENRMNAPVGGVFEI